MVVAKRSCFNWVCVQQLVVVCCQLRWAFDNAEGTREEDWLAERLLVGISTLINENGFKYMRHKEPDNTCLSHVAKWAAMLHSPLVASDFKFEHVNPEIAPSTKRGQTLPKNLFKPFFRDSWDGLHDVVGMSKIPGRSTLNSDSFPYMFMDMLACRHIAACCRSNWGVLEHLWKTAVLVIEHIMV